MKFSEYFIKNNDGKSNCVIRTFCEIFDKEYGEVDKIRNILLSMGITIKDIDNHTEWDVNI